MSAIKLTGMITRAGVVEGTLPLSVDVGQSVPANLSVQIVHENANVERTGQALLAKICHHTKVWKLHDQKQLVGRQLGVSVIQPKVADGLLAPLVVVGLAL